MATILVINHGTTADQDEANNVLAILSRANKNNGSVVLIDTPGFASKAFNRRWLKEHLNFGPLSAIQAKSFMTTVASKWFDEDLDEAKKKHAGVNDWRDIDKLVFVGWSRGCITTWYQIFYLQQNNIFKASRPKICIFHIDPCYGPSNWKSDIKTAMNYIGPSDVLEEAYAVNESGVEKILPGVYALYPYNQGVCKRFFLPGKHATGVRFPDDSYGLDTIQLYTQRLRDFLDSHVKGAALAGIPTANGDRMGIYTRFKMSFMNKAAGNYRFNRAQRSQLWTLNDEQKKAAGIDKTRFFMNQQEYDLYYPLPNLRRVLSRNGEPSLNEVKTDMNNLKKIYPFTEHMIRRWAKQIPKLNSYRRNYLNKYKEVFLL